MAFEPKNITKDHIIRGVAKIQEEQPELKSSVRWDVLINGKNDYPPVDRDEVYKEIFEQAENYKKNR